MVVCQGYNVPYASAYSPTGVPIYTGEPIFVFYNGFHYENLLIQSGLGLDPHVIFDDLRNPPAGAGAGAGANPGCG